MNTRARDEVLGSLVQTPLGWLVRVIASDLTRVRLDFGHGLRMWVALDEFRSLCDRGVLTERVPMERAS
jgi:hypothetical protein